jgi:hypothetical protein
MNYGKPIDAGRLCKMPENTLEPFLYEGFYENSGFEEECYQSDKFFLVGVEQQWEGLRNMGILNIISAALEMPVKDLMAAIKKKIAANPTIFSILQNGKILRDFYDHKEFVDMITKIFIMHALVDEEWLALDWMGIFADILFYYFNVVIVEFTDMRHRDSHEIISESTAVESTAAEPTAAEPTAVESTAAESTAAKSDKSSAAITSKRIPRSKSAKISKSSAKVDKTTAKLIAKSQIEELMPGDFVELKINQKLDVIIGDAGQQYKYILILTKHMAVYPIYLVNPVVYFKTKVVNKRIYEHTDNVIGILGKFLLYAKELTAKQAAESEPEIDTIAQLTSVSTTTIDTKHKYISSYYTTLSALSVFLENKTAIKYSLAKFYVNAHNLCYYIELRDKSSNSIYIPVSLTNWSPRKGVEIDYKPYSYSGKMDIKTLNKFLTEYNNWIQTHSNGVNDGIRIDKWISRKGKVFGFMFGALNYYFDEISESAAIAIKKVPVWNMLYDLADINKQIHTNAPVKADPLVKDISDGFYNNHLYQLLLLEFNTLFAREKNVDLRTKLKKLIINYSKNTLVELFEDILKILDTYYVDFIPAASKVASASTSAKSDKIESNTKKGKVNSQSNKSAEELKAEESAVIWKTLKLEDYNRLIEIINSGIVNFMDKADIYRNIDQGVFNFDKMAINRFKTMTHDQVKRELTGTPPKVAELPNILVPCTTSSAYYCRSNKLVMPEKKLNSLLDILVADIKNPMKEKWIFSPLFNDSIINFLKFEYRPLETISIELA